MNSRRFSEDDFFDLSESIEVDLSIILNEIEIGVFEDYFDPEDSSQINILVRQDAPEENIEYLHKETGDEIPYGKLRCINFIKYDSLRTPKDELSFYRGKGVGKFLKYLITKFIGEDENVENYINNKEFGAIKDFVNQKLSKLKFFREFAVTASIENELIDLVFRLFSIKDRTGLDIQKSGYGTQFSILIVLTLLEHLMYLIEDKKRQDCIFTSDSDKHISVVIGLDEPEIHLHPYMQRRLIKHIDSLLRNQDDDFTSLVKELFDISKIDGQAIIVTHSPAILLNSYKYYSRFYLESGSTKIISGENISLEGDVEKHLLKLLPFIKEAFFSRTVILVEGDSEAGILPVWSENLGFDMDEYGISVIQTGGSGGLPKVEKLLASFKVPTICIVDRDVYDRDPGVYDVIEELVVTDQNDLEEEIVNVYLENDETNSLFVLVEKTEERGLNRKIQKMKLKKTANKYGIDINWNEKDYKFIKAKNEANDSLTKTMFLSWLSSKKTIIFWKQFAEEYDNSLIPPVYKKALTDAVDLATENNV